VAVEVRHIAGFDEFEGYSACAKCRKPREPEDETCGLCGTRTFRGEGMDVPGRVVWMNPKVTEDQDGSLTVSKRGVVVGRYPVGGWLSWRAL